MNTVNTSLGISSKDAKLPKDQTTYNALKHNFLRKVRKSKMITTQYWIYKGMEHFSKNTIQKLWIEYAKSFWPDLTVEDFIEYEKHFKDGNTGTTR